MIVTKSMSQSFIVLLILQTVQCVLKWAVLGDSYEIWWTNFKTGIYVEPVLLSLIIFGTILSINKKHK